jgi:hypothetical protein
MRFEGLTSHRSADGLFCQRGHHPCNHREVATREANSWRLPSDKLKPEAIHSPAADGRETTADPAQER